ncbi:hypothetical protein ACS0PU_000356 [Formica fusca]
MQRWGIGRVDRSVNFVERFMEAMLLFAITSHASHPHLRIMVETLVSTLVLSNTSRSFRVTSSSATIDLQDL